MRVSENLAEIYAHRGDRSKAEALLRNVLAVVPEETVEAVEGAIDKAADETTKIQTDARHGCPHSIACGDFLARSSKGREVSFHSL